MLVFACITISLLISIPTLQELPTAPLVLADNCQVVESDFPTIHSPFFSTAENVAQTRSLTGKWKLQWNDTVDSNATEFPHACSIKFNQIDSTLSGKFIGPVAGTEREAIITGKLDGHGAARLLTFQQRESGYTCSYQAIDNDGAINGVWHDTQNRSGSFLLLKYQ